MPDIAVLSRGLLRVLKSVGAGSDTPADKNALHDPLDSSKSGIKEASNALLVGTSGNVKIRFLDMSEQTLPFASGMIHNLPPFIHVYDTGSDPNPIFVGVTHWQAPGQPS